MAKEYLGGIQEPEVHVVKKTFGCFGLAGCDFNGSNAGNHTQENFNIFAVPAKCRVQQIECVCTTAAVGVTDITFTFGNASAGSQYTVAISCNALNEVTGIINPALPQAVVMNWAAATAVWMGVDPTDNTWLLLTAGKWSIYITYVDYTNV